MQIVVNIEDSIYKEVKNSKSVPDISGTTIVNCIEAIKNGKPLPKYCRLIDTHDLKMCIIARMIAIETKNNISTKDLDDVINNEVKTILEANEE